MKGRIGDPQILVLPAVQGTFVDLAYEELGDRTARVQLRPVASVGVGNPNLCDPVFTAEVFDQASGRTSFIIDW